MTPEYQIAALWMEGPLSFLEQLCLQSFLDAGHHVKLYHYGPLQNVPDGCELADANEILPQKNFLKHERTGSPALHSDIFRYRMLEKLDRTIWADTDAYCVKPFETPNGHFYGWESVKHINGGVLGLPHDSETLRELLAFTTDEFAIPVWYGPDYVQELEEARDRGEPVHAGEQPWGVWGPHALTHFLHVTGEARFALNREGLYPFSFKERRQMLKPDLDTTGIITENTFSIHLYGRRMRARIYEREGGEPHPQSLLGKLILKHGIVPSEAPVPVPKQKFAVDGKKAAAPAAPQAAPAPARQPEMAGAAAAPAAVAARAQPAPAPAPAPAAAPVAAPVPGVEPVPAAAKYGRGQLNLTDLADRYGSDKGSKKHRYTELYQLLFLPYRERAIRFLEMGLLIGGPEHGKSADRETNDLPSIRMWLEYFTKAEVHGLDVSDFSWFEHDRFAFHRCDMDRRENIAAAAAGMPEFDIIIDDASHASHHQAYGFLELFPKLASGGIYVIEDLRWQPEVLERPGITKTAAFIQSYLDTGVFSHSDPEIAEGFNDLRIDISGCFLHQVKFQKRRRDQVAVIHKR